MGSAMHEATAVPKAASAPRIPLRTANARPGSKAAVWWSVPHIFTFTILFPIAALITAKAGDVADRNGFPNYITVYFIILLFVGLLMFGVSCYIGSKISFMSQDISVRGGALDFLFWFCVTAYAIWFVPLIVTQPQMVIGALTGAAGATYAIRVAAPPISGLTTITQFGIAYACIYSTKKFIFNEPVRIRYDIYFIIILILSFFRASINSERIALLEVVFPTIVILSKLRYMKRSIICKNRGVYLIFLLFPVLTIVGAPFIFGLFEYNRSWLIEYQYKYDNIIQFSFERLVLYYTTSLNNICGFMTSVGWPSWDGGWTLEWLYRFPIIGSILHPKGDNLATRFGLFLINGANPEFNNTNGIVVVFQDWGLAGGLISLGIYGLIVGISFRQFRLSRGVLQFAYPIMFFSLYELLRIGYIYDGRCVAALIGLFLALALWRSGTPSRKQRQIPTVLGDKL